MFLYPDISFPGNRSNTADRVRSRTRRNSAAPGMSIRRCSRILRSRSRGRKEHRRQRRDRTPPPLQRALREGIRSSSDAGPGI